MKIWKINRSKEVLKRIFNCKFYKTNWFFYCHDIILVNAKNNNKGIFDYVDAGLWRKVSIYDADKFI